MQLPHKQKPKRKSRHGFCKCYCIRNRNYQHQTLLTSPENRRGHIFSCYWEPLENKYKIRYTGPVENGRVLDIIVGLPDSGKSSAILDVLSKEKKSKLIDNDEIKQNLAGFNNGWGANFVYEETFNRIISEGLVDGYSVWDNDVEMGTHAILKEYENVNGGFIDGAKNGRTSVGRRRGSGSLDLRGRGKASGSVGRVNESSILGQDGESYASNNKPVLTVLGLAIAESSAGLEELYVTNAFEKDNTQFLLDNSEILFIDPNKKRTNAWLIRFRVQFPASINQFGPIKKIDVKTGVVNNFSIPNGYLSGIFPLPFPPPFLSCLMDNVIYWIKTDKRIVG